MTLNLPFFILLIPYALFLLAFVILGIISLVNLVSYAANDGVAFLVTFIFLAATTLIAFQSYQMLIQFDWAKMMPFNLPTLWPSSINI